MKLTGKCKEEFGIWHFERNTPIEEYKSFHLLSETCQNALIIEWFDSVGILIEIQLIASKVFGFDIHTKSIFEDQNVYKSRIEVIAAAITKANEIFNLNNK